MVRTTSDATSSRVQRREGRSPWLMLALATVGFAVNFWAWALLSPLGPLFRDNGALGASPSPTSRCWSRCPWSWGRSAGSWSAR